MSRPAQPYFELFGGLGKMSFIETGTYRGGGVHAALAAGFSKVHSIEPVKSYFDQCSKELASLIRDGRVELHHGPSETVLPRLIDSISGPIFYWLDGHSHGTDTEPTAMHCPLMVEADAISTRTSRAEDVVFIDDVRLLVKPKAWRGHNVRFRRVIGQLQLRFRQHFGCFIDGYEKDDIFCVVPASHARGFFSIIPPPFVPPIKRRGVRRPAEVSASRSDAGAA